MASGFKSGVKDTGSVADLKGTSKVDRHEKTHDVQFAEGGDTPMFGKQEANPDKPGSTGKPDARGPGADFASGGKGKMFGFQGSIPARDGITSAR